jgi:hypothetical protein
MNGWICGMVFWQKKKIQINCWTWCFGSFALVNKKALAEPDHQFKVSPTYCHQREF